MEPSSLFFNAFEIAIQHIEESTHSSDMNECLIRLECVLRSLQSVQSHFCSKAFSSLISLVSTMINCIALAMREGNESLMRG